MIFQDSSRDSEDKIRHDLDELHQRMKSTFEDI